MLPLFDSHFCAVLSVYVSAIAARQIIVALGFGNAPIGDTDLKALRVPGRILALWSLASVPDGHSGCKPVATGYAVRVVQKLTTRKPVEHKERR